MAMTQTVTGLSTFEQPSRKKCESNAELELAETSIKTLGGKNYEAASQSRKLSQEQERHSRHGRDSGSESLHSPVQSRHSEHSSHQHLQRTHNAGTAAEEASKREHRHDREVIPERKRRKLGDSKEGQSKPDKTDLHHKISPPGSSRNGAEGERHASHGHAAPIGTGHAGGPRRSLLSFSDELEDVDTANATFSLAETTKRRFETERPINIASPASAATSVEDHGLSDKSAPSLGQLQFAVSHARGARPYMEDRHAIIVNYCPAGVGSVPDLDGLPRSYAAIFDGHNGSQAADEACSRLHTLLAAERGFARCTGAATEAEAAAMTGAMENAFLALDREILDRARREGGRDGCCALVAVRVGDFLYTAHAGDSRAVLARGGKAVRLTEDHKPGLSGERSRVLEAGGRVEFQRCWRVISGGADGEEPGRRTGLAISRSLGDLDFKEPKLFVERRPDVGRVQLSPGDDLVIMASDGLWDVMDDQTAVDIAQGWIQKEKTLMGVKALDYLAKKASDVLVLAALKKGSLDNITVVLILLRWD